MLGKILGGRYQIVKILRKGGYGQTYLAQDRQRPGFPLCVVKHFKPVSQNSTFLEIARCQFKAEAETLEKLGRHDQIPYLLAYFEENQEFYLVQEFIPGHPLSDELRPGRKLTEPSVITLLQDVLRSLEFVHSYQVIHRDIKPSNLIRRQKDGKLVLIDFGAVKQIQTQASIELEPTEMPVGIGTEGYMPNEQSAGKPRFSSDLYALGMTAIQALTGLKPRHLPENPQTSEIIWRDRVEVSDWLAAILEKMVRCRFGDRYQSATEVVQALQQWTSAPILPTDTTFSVWGTEAYKHDTQTHRHTDRLLEFPSSPHHPILAFSASQSPIPNPQSPAQKAQFSVPEQYTEPLQPSPSSKNLWASLKQQIRQGRRGLILSSSMASFVMLLRLLGLLQSWELAGLNQLFRWRPEEPTDPRIVIVEVNETDRQQVKQWPIPDAVMAKLLQKISASKPRAIGLNFYRDLPVQPGHAKLVKVVESIPNLIGIERLKDEKSLGVPSAPMLNPQQVGFNNVVVDSDGKVRRSLLYWHVDGKPHKSFALQMALMYLKAQNITPQPAKVNPQYLQLGQAVFRPFGANDGAYVNADNGGYQILANFRQAPSFPTISMADVLADKVKPDLMRDRLVLIGQTTSSLNDFFYTPGQEVPALDLYADFVSQILSAALNQRPLIRVWPQLLEVLWIFGWSWVGAILSWRSPSLRWSFVNILIAEASLTGGCYLGFLTGWWLPLIPPTITLMGSWLLISLMKGSNTLGSSDNLFRDQQSPSSSHLVGPETQPSSSSSVSTNLSSALAQNCQQIEKAALEKFLASQRISFLVDSTEIKVRGSLEPNQSLSYSLTCSQEQLLTIETLEGNIYGCVIAPDGHTIGIVTGNATQWQGVLPLDGDYIIEVSAPYASDYAVSFDLRDWSQGESITSTMLVT